MIRVDATIIRKASNDFKNLIREDIRKKGLIKTGTMIRSITSEIKVVNNEVKIKLGAVYYYKFLDNGTKYIEPYYITKDVMKSQKFKDIVKKLTIEIEKVKIENEFRALSGRLYESKIVINKKK